MPIKPKKKVDRSEARAVFLPDADKGVTTYAVVFVTKRPIKHAKVEMIMRKSFMRNGIITHLRVISYGNATLENKDVLPKPKRKIAS